MSPATIQPEAAMRRAIELARLGRGRAEPNPTVGCVLLRGGRIIAEGHHARFGGPHAEAAALLACSEDPAGATAVVTLEPCCHLRKKTPPCVAALLRAGIREVIVGTPDPNPAVSGGGIAQLRAAGVRVSVGLLEGPCRQLIAPWLATLRLGRPYVTLKWAQSSDGRVAGDGGRPVRISGEIASHAVHELRARCDGITVGINTVLTDDPLLTARGVEGARPLLRIVLDRDLRLPSSCRLVQSARSAPLRVYCSSRAAESPAAAALLAQGAKVMGCPLSPAGQLALPAVLASLGRQGLTHLLVECGPTLASAFVSANLADRIWIIRSPLVIGEASAPRAITVGWSGAAERRLGRDTLTEYLNPGSEVYFAPEPSADLPQ